MSIKGKSEFSLCRDQLAIERQFFNIIDNNRCNSG